MCRRQLLLQVVVQLLLAMLVCGAGQSGSTTPDALFRLKRVTKTRVGSVREIYRIRLEYQSSCQPEVLLRKTPDAVPELLDRVVEGQNATELILSACQSDAEVIFWCSDNDLHFKVSLNLTGTPDVMDIPDIDVNAAQGSDVKFQAGSRVQFDYTFDIGGDEDAITMGSIGAQLVFRAEDNSLVQISGLYTRERKSVWLDPRSFSRGPGSRQTASLRIKSSFPDPEGILVVSFDVTFNCAHNCLVRAYSTPYRVQFYRQDHSSPFPEYFLAFVDVGYQGNTANGEPSVTCSTSQGDDPSSPACVLYCEARGSLPSTMTLSRVTPNGLTPVDALTLSGGNWSTAQLRIGDVTARDAGVYRCTAKAELWDGNPYITKDVTLVVTGRN